MLKAAALATYLFPKIKLPVYLASEVDRQLFTHALQGKPVLSLIFASLFQEKSFSGLSHPPPEEGDARWKAPDEEKSGSEFYSIWIPQNETTDFLQPPQ
ncbi:hypothetical protein [Flavonifractor sp. An100]|uniref:hypothetical protein n=1 Tax=Flavonifractor sp. An100 TaxID=1965538 RepID=UPI0013029A69|nr:hypothetical protein [Flavonifractor sp. An100]